MLVLPFFAAGAEVCEGASCSADPETKTALSLLQTGLKVQNKDVRPSEGGQTYRGACEAQCPESVENTFDNICGGNCDVLLESAEDKQKAADDILKRIPQSDTLAIACAMCHIEAMKAGGGGGVEPLHIKLDVTIHDEDDHHDHDHDHNDPCASDCPESVLNTLDEICRREAGENCDQFLETVSDKTRAANGILAQIPANDTSAQECARCHIDHIDGMQLK